NILNRSSPNGGEVAGWVSALPTAGRFNVVMGFLRSHEYTDNLARQWYEAYGLGSPSVDNLAAVGWDLRRGRLEEQVLTDVLTSTGDCASTQKEGWGLRPVYRAVLQPPPPPAETAYWLGQMENGLSLPTIAGIIVHSNEYNILLARSYY